MQEVARGGQVFFIHNRVQNMSVFTEMIRKVVPNVRIRSAHGQMSGKELEKIIGDFYHHKFDVLVSTNIVENGIDISNANTIIINHAQNFGLAELHQLRGRVGRSNRKAFCYLITPPFEDLSVHSRKRLMALEEYSDLGSGFNIAMRDLDIRGAGDVLGAEQSGFINELGFDLYNKILNDAIKELKETEYSGVFDDVKTPEETPDTVIEIDLEAIINNDYVEDDVERLNLYRRIARAKTDLEIDEWVEEVKDRFGPLPKSVKNLITVARIRLYASSRYIEKVTIRADRMWLQCPSNKKESGQKFYEDGRFKELFEEVQKNAGDRLQLIQKEHVVRFMIKEIPDLEAAEFFLKKLFNESITAHELI
jgi:transcription-repair coupling factor (superfamily II helicase)